MRRATCLLPWILALCVWSAFAVLDGHVPLVTEFMASNASTLADEDGDYSDWIELHNPTSARVDLRDWALTDDLDEPRKWVLAEASIEPGGYLVVFASGKDRRPGAGSWTSVVRLGDEFSYFPGSTAPPSNWTESAFDDAAWERGASPLGYERSAGGADIQTEVDEGLLALYARVEFDVQDPSNVRRALLHVDYDDGFIAYLNGREIAREYMAAGTPTFEMPASGLHEAQIYQGGRPDAFDVDREHLQVGRNVLAIEVHNVSATSSDLTLIPFLSLELTDPEPNARAPSPEIGPLVGTEHHTNFSLSRGGESLALVDPAGNVVSSYESFPEQRADVSYGLVRDGASYFTTPTPGEANATGTGGIVDAPLFSAAHGFYDSPFSLFLFPGSENSVIRYTEDGTSPTDSTGKPYIGPLLIDETTVVRAAAFREGAQRSDVVTRTFLFPADIVRQSADGAPPSGWPRSWGANAVDYGMDPNVVGQNVEAVHAALEAIPSFSIAIENEALFDATTGIYANALEYGEQWERPGSVELIYPPDFDSKPEHGPLEGFQVDAGIRIRGGWSRNDGNPKHAFRMFFRSEYGPGLLDYPLFGTEGADRFDKIDLRTSQNYSWSFTGDQRNTLVRDVFARDMQRDMGVPYTRSRYYHLYLNGQYWGLFQTQERADHEFGATYLGGRADDFDVVKSAGLDGGYEVEITTGTIDAWRALYDGANQTAAADTNEERDEVYLRLQGLNPDGSRNAEYPVLLDPDNLIQYMLVIFWTGNPDAPITPFMGTNNFFGIRDRTGDRGFVWFAHDSEHTLLTANANELDRTGPFTAGDEFRFSNPQWIHQQLMGSKEYRLRFADYVHKHLFDGGALTSAPSVARWDKRVEELEEVVIAESARWGDAKREPARGPADWRREVDRVRNTILPTRRDALVEQLRVTRRYRDGISSNETIPAPLYPHPSAPLVEAAAGSFTLTGDVDADIYYTLDGSDPRQRGGRLAPSAISFDGGPVSVAGRQTIQARALADDSTWSALSEAEVFGENLQPAAGAVILSEIHYHPLPPNDDEAAAGFDDANDYEFVELHNRSATPVALGGLRFTEGIDFAFGNETLDADERVVVVSNLEAFRLRYGSGPRVAGAFSSGRLANGGEQLTLSNGIQDISSVRYGDGDPWPSRADGAGSSLERVPDQPESEPLGWRAGLEIGGSPGTAGRRPVQEVVVNEVLTHTDPPLLDAVELHNITDEAIDLSGWYLGDRPSFRKYRVPDGSIIEAGGFVVFDESDFNASGAETDFAFDSARGDEVWLVASESDRPVRFADHVFFGAARNGESMGRASIEDGELVPMAEPTLGAPNSAPLVGSVILREIMYHPPGNSPYLEYITVLNASNEDVDMTSWTLRSGVDYVFPAGYLLAAGDSVVGTAFDPATEPTAASIFRDAYGWSEQVRLLGGWTGRLANDGERITLHRPDEPPADGPSFVPEVLQELVVYGDHAPWSVASDGRGAALFRSHIASFANSPQSWADVARPFILYEDHQTPDPPPVPTTGYSLSALYPNPSTDRTPGELTVGATQQVSATLYDMLGRRVHVLFDDTVQADTLEPLVIETTTLASGVYVVRLEGRTFSTSRLITVIR